MVGNLERSAFGYAGGLVGGKAKQSEGTSRKSLLLIPGDALVHLSNF
jgi:hypothetical protein